MVNNNLNLFDGLNIIIPLHNKENSIQNTISKIYEKFQNENIFIIVIENKSTDNSYQKAKQCLEKLFPDNNLLLISDIGKGRAIKEGLNFTKYKWTLLTSADLPFEFSDIDLAIQDNLNHDLYLGSKSHPQSKIERELSRIFFSNFYYLWRKLILGLNFKDTQGSHIIKNDILQKIKPYLKSNDFFIDTEIVYFASLFTNKIIEVPIVLSSTEVDGSTVKPFKDGFKMLIQTMGLRQRKIS